MSTTLPVINAQPKSGGDPAGFLQQLLAEQQSLSAVEAFSEAHDAQRPDEPAQARYYKKLLPATAPGPGQQYSFEVDLDQCSGCKACVVACHTMNGLEDDESWRRVGTLTIGESSVLAKERAEQESHVTPVSMPQLQHVTTACHHCEDPGCLNGCPVKAYDKDPETGIVRHLDDQCIGCKYCTMMCPYEVPQYSERLGIVRKCDMCHQRLSAGEAPACVQSCPNEAIAIRVVDTEQAVDEESRLSAGAPLSSITRPTTVFTSTRVDLVADATPQNDRVDNVAESHWPLAVMLVATQISVGMLLAERLAALVLAAGGFDQAGAATRWNATAALLIAGIGMGIAPLHLGQPLRAWRVFLGLRTSWLSREAVVLGKYMGLLSVAAALLWMPIFKDYVPAWFLENVPVWAGAATLGVAIVTGAAGLFSSGMIYVATRRTLWRFSRTFIRFFGTSLIAGAAWTAAVLCLAGSSMFVTTLVVLATVLTLVAKLAWEHRVQAALVETPDDYDVRSAVLIAGPLGTAADIRRDFAVAGIGLIGIAWLIAFAMPAVGGSIAILAAIAISGGELVERLLYFQSVVYDRMPGTLN